MALLNQFLDNPAVNFTKGDNPRALKDLQANIFRHHGKQRALHVFVEFKSNTPAPEQFQWLNQLKLTNSFIQLHDHIFGLEFSENSKSPKILTTAYVSYHGFKWLGFGDNKIPGNHNPAFKEGPLFRTKFKKDLKACPTLKVQFMFLLAGDDKKELEKAFTIMFENFRQPEAAIPDNFMPEKGSWGNCFIQWGEKDDHDPMGYKDGISNPIFFPDLKKYPASKSRQIDHPRLVLVQDVNGAYQHSTGSFLAFLKFEVDRDGFEREMGNIAASNNPGEIKLAGAMMVGRFENGTPVTLSDNHKIEGLGSSNYFDYTEWMPDKDGKYKDDLDGIRCPYFAHTRNANPRDPHYYNKRIVRRGVNYSEKSGEGNAVKGLLFQSFQADIKGQFEHIVNEWLHNDYGGKRPPDPLTFNHEKSVEGTTYHFPEWNMNTKKEVHIIKQSFVTLKGGWYFFTPAISFFKMLKPPRKEPKAVRPNETVFIVKPLNKP